MWTSPLAQPLSAADIGSAEVLENASDAKGVSSIRSCACKHSSKPETQNLEPIATFTV